MRDPSIDLLKGIAILFVYLGHSILYHPIQMEQMYEWCRVLGRFIESFNMPLFFIISGFLFSNTQKRTIELYKGKVQRLLIPYLFTMAILIGVKLVLPTSLSYNEAAGRGVIPLIENALLNGGDRWFVYVLFVMYLFVIPFRSVMKNKVLLLFTALILIGVYYLDFLPALFRLDSVFYFLFFFLLGYALHDYWQLLKEFCRKYWYVTFSVFLIFNLVLIIPLEKVSFVYRFLLPISGSLGCLSIAVLLERADSSKMIQYVSYCGKYSLQFYLFTFCYPIIRWGIVSVAHITNSALILLSVFVLQLIAITIIIEITRRISFLRIPCGY